jgi:Zn-dependent peptidase ImmA (M78 family)/transcriptional regulator with XRE-family HTH domain
VPSGKAGSALPGEAAESAEAILTDSPVAGAALMADAVASAFDPRRLTLARVRNGWTKRRLAEVVGVSSAAITQYELGQARPSGASLARLAVQLGVPPRYLAAGRPFINVRPADAHFRSLRSATVSEREQSLAVVAHLAELVIVLSRIVRLPAVTIPDAISDGGDGPEREARSLRRAWELGAGPIPHLVRQAEMHGIVVAVARFGSSERVDAFSCWPERLDRPVICLSSDRGNVLRRRFSAAHEIGHLILHRGHPDPGSTTNEHEADRFAAELLMPADDIAPSLPRRPDLATLIELQQQWGVSVQALLRRCNDLQTISSHMYKRGMIAISQLGWRRDEPSLDYDGEWPAMLGEAARLAQTRGVTESVLAEGLCLPASEVRELLGFQDEDRPRLQLVTDGGL